MKDRYEEELKKLYEADKKLCYLNEARAIASYEITAVAPPKAAGRRAEVLGFLTNERYELITSKEFGETLSYLSECKDKTDLKIKALLRQYTREKDELCKIPQEMYQSYTMLKTRAEAQWQISKAENDYQSVKPYLQAIIDQTNEMIDQWGCTDTRFDTLLRYREQGMTTDRLDNLFSEIKNSIVPLAAKISKCKETDDTFLYGNFDTSKQKLFCNHLLREIGFDHERGVMCQSEHPYTSGINRDDVRVTNHYYTGKVMPAIFSALHEGGHGLYEQNVAPEYTGTALSGGIDGGMHEASSRFWENIVGRSSQFWERELPYLKLLFPSELTGVDAPSMYKAINKVSSTPIRIYADEVTYNLHIMLRYELEKEIFNDRLSADDLPEAWNEKMHKYLGIKPKQYSEGILQDVHWFSGLFGYFQSYTLGNIYNAQIAAAMMRDIDLDSQIAGGHCDVILNWLREKWYRYGQLYTAEEIIRNMCGEDISARYLCGYLKNKYSAIYNI